ncbi:MAG: AAA family ATPase, partial [Clostridia bacterium]|nr:AAA family ATPase [Clostridia bacterium]
RLLYTHHGNKPVILLIDEYDVPMAKGDAHGYYGDIINIMRSMYNKALKDNPYIKFAVLTGCLRIAKESIFTGLNNPKIYSILDYGFQEYFGFTDREIDRLLADTGFTEYKEKIKQWYDGYRFGDTDIYCPWDVLNYVSDLQQKAGVEPKDYWANTSGNDILKQFLNSKFNPRSDFEALLNGKCIKKRIVENITYNDLISSEDNLWSVLLMTGYLTVVPEDEVPAEDISSNDINGVYLRLVNNEIKELFSTTVSDWFKETVYKNSRDDLFKSLWDGDAAELANIISRYLRTTISFYDYSESFYHAFLAGLFSGFGDISVTQKRKPGSISIKSNREYGEGRADVVIENRVTHTAAVLEFKVADNITDVSSMCDVALSQIHDIGYAEALQEDEGYDLISYGVIFYKKRCFIKKG